MRNSLAGWLVGLWGLMACSGQNVVAGEEKTKAEQLQSSLPGWCASTCTRLAQCEVEEDCSCTGDSCVCTGTVDEDCAEECQEEMSRFTQGSDACATTGQLFKDCIDDAGCAVLTEVGLCGFTEAQEDECPRPGNPDPQNTGGPNYGTGGTGADGPVVVGGTSFTAGSANSGSGPVECAAGHGTGGGPGALGWPSLICEAGYEGCSDGHDYLMYCVRTSETATTCSCLVDQQVVGGFDPGGPVCPTSQQMNAGCRWNLEVE